MPPQHKQMFPYTKILGGKGDKTEGAYLELADRNHRTAPLAILSHHLLRHSRFQGLQFYHRGRLATRLCILFVILPSDVRFLHMISKAGMPRMLE